MTAAMMIGALAMAQLVFAYLAWAWGVADGMVSGGV